MASTVQILSAVLLVALVALTWRLPRRFGLPGLFVAQVLVAAGCFSLGVVSVMSGLWVYDDRFVFVRLLFQAALLNGLLLPIALLALWRRGRVLESADRQRHGLLLGTQSARTADDLPATQMPVLPLAAIGRPD